MKIIEKEKGIAIYISLVIMTFLLTMGLGLTIIVLGQMRMLRDIGNSVIAFHAADSGIEEGLYRQRQLNDTSNINNTPLDNGASYSALYNEDPVARTATWQSMGVYRGESRAIEITSTTPYDFLLDLDGNELPPFGTFKDSPPGSNYAGCWCVPEEPSAATPEFIYLRTQLLSGDDDWPIDFTCEIIEYDQSVQRYTHGCNASGDPNIWVDVEIGPPSDCPLITGCSRVLTFTFYRTSGENWRFDLIITGGTDILTKSILFNGSVRIGTCTCGV